MLTTTAGILGYESRLCPVYWKKWLKLIQNSRIKIDSQYCCIIGVCLALSADLLMEWWQKAGKGRILAGEGGGVRCWPFVHDVAWKLGGII